MSTLADDWVVYLKELLDVYQKIGGISHEKRVVIRQFQTRSKDVITKVRCLLNYPFDSSTEPFRSITRKGRDEENLLPLTELPKHNEVTREKKGDVLQLLEPHYGGDWRGRPELIWFQNASGIGEYGPAVSEEIEECECLEEDPYPTHI